MRHFSFAAAALVTASLLAACSGAGSPSTGSTLPQTHYGALNSKLPKFLRIMHTPARPPARRHQVTAAMRINAKKGGWQELAAAGPFSNGAGSELLLTDGTVMVQDYCTPNWFRLTPDKNGNYQNGKWSKMGSMPSSYGPLYFASAVLADGSVMVNGGEYNFCVGDETTLGAAYDPVKDKWTAVSAPSGWGELGDGDSAVLTNGTYMVGNCCYTSQAEYNEKKSTWTIVGTGKNDQNSEEAWALLPNGELLLADVFSEPASELFNPNKGSWSSAGTVPVNLTQSDEIGPTTLMYNGTVFVGGADQYTAIYNLKSGKWTEGPNFPTGNGGQLDMADAPSSVLTNGEVMLATSPGVYSTPETTLLWNGKKFTTISSPAGAVNDSSYNVRFLLLPTGQVLWADGSNDVEIYTGTGSPMTSIAPVISKLSSATLTPGSTYTIEGKRFNGYSQANFYGDDDQQATNYPLVRITNNASGHVFYAKTHDHSYMGVASSKKVSTMFDVPSGIETGASKLEVVANGIASKAMSVTIGSP